MEPKILTAEDVTASLKAALGPFGEEVAELRAEAKANGEELAKLKGENSAMSNIKALLAGIQGERKSADPLAEAGINFARGVQCLVLGKGDVQRALKVVKDGRYGKGAATESLVRWFESGEERTGGFVVKALGSNDFDAGGALAPGGRTNEVIELLRPASVVRSLNPTIVPLDMGTLPVPRLSGGATATYQGENLARNTTQQTTNDVSLTAKQLGCLVVVSNKLLEVASVDVDNMIRQDCIAAVAQKEDETFLISDGTQQKPRGMRYWAAIANVSATAFANTLDGIVTASQTALLALLNGNVRMLRPGWIFTHNQAVRIANVRDGNGNFPFMAEMAAGRFMGFPWRATTQMTASNFTFADFADVMIGQLSTITIDASNVAAYNDSTGTVQSSYSRDQTVVRLLESHDLALRHDESVFWATNAAWIPA